jgi:hypothetical protein
LWILEEDGLAAQSDCPSEFSTLDSDVKMQGKRLRDAIAEWKSADDKDWKKRNETGQRQGDKQFARCIIAQYPSLSDAHTKTFLPLDFG